jgi:hypothetical protein
MSLRKRKTLIHTGESKLGLTLPSEVWLLGGALARVLFAGGSAAGLPGSRVDATWAVPIIYMYRRPVSSPCRACVACSKPSVAWSQEVDPFLASSSSRQYRSCALLYGSLVLALVYVQGSCSSRPTSSQQSTPNSTRRSHHPNGLITTAPHSLCNLRTMP